MIQIGYSMVLHTVPLCVIVCCSFFDSVDNCLKLGTCRPTEMLRTLPPWMLGNSWTIRGPFCQRSVLASGTLHVVSMCTCIFEHSCMSQHFRGLFYPGVPDCNAQDVWFSVYIKCTCLFFVAIAFFCGLPILDVLCFATCP